MGGKTSSGTSRNSKLGLTKQRGPVVPTARRFRELYGGEEATGFAEEQAAGNVFEGPYDKKPRFEISDHASKIIAKLQPKQPVVANLDEVFDHPELFKQYPGFKQIRTRLWVDPSFPPELEGGDFRLSATPDSDGELVFTVDVKAARAKDVHKYLLHELQHAIQEVEDFAKGGSPYDTEVEERAQRIIADRIAPSVERKKEIYAIINKEIDEKMASGDKRKRDDIEDDIWSKHPQLDFEWRQLENATAGVDPSILPSDLLMSLYTKLAGEIEARDVEARKDLTPEERKEEKPYSSENIPPEEAIVKKPKRLRS